MVTNTMPDVTSDISSDTPSTLKWVGMEKIAIPMTMTLDEGKRLQVAAKANVFVSLDSPESKGIHMSRVHLAINQLANIDCNKDNLNQLLDDMISSQGSISRHARIELSFDLILSKPALLSDESGFQSYPVVIKAEKKDQGFNCGFELTIAYSSTCPCSASLARQLYANALDSAFPDSTINKDDLLTWAQSQAGSVATPHSQRSYAYVHFSMGGADWPDLVSMIFKLEKVIGTPVFGNRKEEKNSYIFKRKKK